MKTKTLTALTSALALAVGSAHAARPHPTFLQLCRDYGKLI